MVAVLLSVPPSFTNFSIIAPQYQIFHDMPLESGMADLATEEVEEDPQNQHSSADSSHFAESSCVA